MVLSVSQATEIASPLLLFSLQGAWTPLGLHALWYFWSPLCMRAYRMCLGRNTTQQWGGRPLQNKSSLSCCSAIPNLKLGFGAKSWPGKTFFLKVIFEGAGCGRVLLCKCVSIHGKSKRCFLVQDIIQCYKDWESSMYKCSTNMTHIFYSHELILSMIKSRNSPHYWPLQLLPFFLVYEK